MSNKVTINPAGEIIAKHRKMHLFDIDVPGKITFKESDTLSAGNSVTTFDSPFGKVQNILNHLLIFRFNSCVRLVLQYAMTFASQNYHNLCEQKVLQTLTASVNNIKFFVLFPGCGIIVIPGVS